MSTIRNDFGATIRRGQSTGNRPSASHQEKETPKPRASLNFIPTPDALDDLVNRAVSALRKGVAWDRGSILNILL